MSAAVVLPYDPDWAARFAAIRERVWPAISDLALAMEHVGSTSVPGLAAKPVIDIDVVIRAAGDLDAVAVRLAALGYERRGDLGISQREAFREPPGSARHSLYVCPQGAVPLRNHLGLRDYLRAHPEAAARYGALKLALAAAHADDINAYVRGKTDFVIGILRQVGLDAAAIAEIEAANKSF